jgi:hypothetical protein
VLIGWRSAIDAAAILLSVAVAVIDIADVPLKALP